VTVDMSLAAGGPVPGADAGLLTSIARRFNARTLAIGLVVTAALVVVGGMGLIVQVWDAPMQTKLTRLVDTAVTGAFILIAVLVADSLTERGAPRAMTYAIAIVVAAFIGAIVGWYVRLAFGLTFRGPPSGATAGPLLNTAHRIASM